MKTQKKSQVLEGKVICDVECFFNDSQNIHTLGAVVSLSDSFSGAHKFFSKRQNRKFYPLPKSPHRQRALSGEHICVSLRQFFLCCALHWWMSWSVARKSTSSRAKKLGKAISGKAVESSRDMPSGLHEANCSLDKSKQTHKRASEWNGAEWNRMKKSWGGYNRLRIFDVSFCVLLGKNDWW